MAVPEMSTLRDIREQVAQGQISIEDAAMRFTYPELMSALQETRAHVREIPQHWTPEQLRVRPEHHTNTEGEDRWSATEALTHLMATQNWYMMNMGRLVGRREQFERMPRSLGDLAEQDVTREDLRDRVEQETERFFTFLRSIPPDADMNARRDSRYYGELSLRGWVMLAIIHDLDHLAQMQRLTFLPAFPV
jgi:uncharacterized damage-inducible protein DinB